MVLRTRETVVRSALGETASTSQIQSVRRTGAPPWPAAPPAAAGSHWEDRGTAARRSRPGPGPARARRQGLPPGRSLSHHRASTRQVTSSRPRMPRRPASLRAARLSPDSPPASGAATIVVTIEEASASERVELFGRAFGLSAREYELLGLLATGSDTRSDGARDVAVRAHDPGSPQVDLRQDWRPRPRYRSIARPRKQTRGTPMSGPVPRPK